MCPYCGVHQDIREFIVHSSVAYVVGSSVNIYDYAMLQV